MDKINPAAYITDVDPTPEGIITSSNWYEWQNIDIEDGTQIPWLLAQGWVITSTRTSFNAETGLHETYQWSLKRRVLRPESALRDLIISFTNAYNTGRNLNDQRYDEIVTLYTVMLDKSEDEMNSLSSDNSTYDDLVETILAELSASWTTLSADLTGVYDDYGTDATDRINTQFDNRVAEARASLIDRGAYNSTIWDSINTGIERERASALGELADKITDRDVALKDRLYSLKADMQTKILAARDRIRSYVQNSEIQTIGMRNQVLQALLQFMERREDGYPDLGTIGQLATNLGAGQGGSYPTS